MSTPKTTKKAAPAANESSVKNFQTSTNQTQKKKVDFQENLPKLEKIKTYLDQIEKIYQKRKVFQRHLDFIKNELDKTKEIQNEMTEHQGEQMAIRIGEKYRDGYEIKNTNLKIKILDFLTQLFTKEKEQVETELLNLQIKNYDLIK